MPAQSRARLLPTYILLKVGKTYGLWKCVDTVAADGNSASAKPTEAVAIS